MMTMTITVVVMGPLGCWCISLRYGRGYDRNCQIESYSGNGIDGDGGDAKDLCICIYLSIYLYTR